MFLTVIIIHFRSIVRVSNFVNGKCYARACGHAIDKIVPAHFFCNQAKMTSDRRRCCHLINLYIPFHFSL